MQKFNYRPASVTVTLPDKKYIMKLAQNLMLFHTVMVGSVGSITIELQRAGTFTVTLASSWSARGGLLELFNVGGRTLFVLLTVTTEQQWAR